MIKKHDNDKVLSLETTSSLILGLSDSMYLVEGLINLTGAIRNEFKGIYLFNSSTPLIKENTKYYANFVLLEDPINQIPDLRCAITDDENNVVIPEFVMLNQSKFLRGYPKHNLHALMLIIKLIEDELVRVCPFAINDESRVDPTIIDYYFNPRVQDIIASGKLEDICHPIISIMSEFIGNDNYHIYFVKVNEDEATLTINKTIDHRIYEWTKQQYDIKI
jgi:hypothetical protein